MADQGVEGLLSSFLRKQRIQAARPYLKGRVLDFGCGSGELAQFVPADQYIGVEIDSASLHNAVMRYPAHCFMSDLPHGDEKFDNIVLLAVIEHVYDPVELLNVVIARLSNSPSARIIVTTPHPLFASVHYLGSVFGIFSKHANKEHKALLGRETLEKVGAQVGLRILFYKRFLFAANQLVIFERELR